MLRLVRRAGVLVTLLALGAVTALGGPASATGGGPQTRQQFGPGATAFGRLLRIGQGEREFLADFPTFEANHNPDAPPGQEIATNGILSGDFTGRLVRVNRNGSRTVLASEGLFAPGGFAIAHDGSIYVTNNGILAGAGQALRIPAR
jgi:hypothetical protein